MVMLCHFFRLRIILYSHLEHFGLVTEKILHGELRKGRRSG